MWATEHETREEIIDRYRRVWEHSDVTITEAWYFGEVFGRPFPERLPWGRTTPTSAPTTPSSRH